MDFFLSLATSLLGNIITKGMEKIPSFLNMDKRQKSVQGTWQGHLQQRKNKTAYNPDVSITLTISVKRRKVFGEAKYMAENMERTLQIEGGFYDATHIYVQYENSNPQTLQNGTILMKLSGDGNKITGQYLGIGILSEDIVSGMLTLHKEENTVIEIGQS